MPISSPGRQHEVVAELRERLSEETGKRGKLAAALQRLNEMNRGPS